VNTAAVTIPIPDAAILNNTDPGRQVQNAALDLHGLSGIPAGFGREFYTKYDYSYYEYLHQAHGIFGPTFGAWTIVPRLESLSGGPTKQDLVLTDSILMMEAQSGHFNSGMLYTPPQGVATTRIFGPYGFHFNAFDGTLKTSAELYQDALNTIPTANTFADGDGVLHGLGYVVSSDRGSVMPSISGAGSPTANTSWIVLSDQFKNHQLSSNGRQYWKSNNGNGNETITGVAPGTYRLSAYVLGEWGELRKDGITVATGGATTVPGLTFTPENFSSSAPIWTIGTPNRTSHEFLRGHAAGGVDDREYFGNWNYWKDFAATNGAVVYYATAVGSHAATNNLDLWNYVQWVTFDPGLYAGIYNAGDDTTDGYQYIIPSYVNTLPGASGTNGVTTPTPPWQVHFTTTSAQQAQGQYTVVSVALADTNGSLTANLNGRSITWNAINRNDATVRSGLSGYTQWVVFEFPTSMLNSAGSDNVLTFTVGNQGVMYDAIRMEITNTSANPSTKNWHDYEYVNSTTYVPANDAVANN
jgi:hypothetical protein